MTACRGMQVAGERNFETSHSILSNGVSMTQSPPRIVLLVLRRNLNGLIDFAREVGIRDMRSWVMSCKFLVPVLLPPWTPHVTIDEKVFRYFRNSSA